MKRLNIGVARKRIEQINEYLKDVRHEIEIADGSNTRDDQAFRIFVRDTLIGIWNEADKAINVLNRRIERHKPL